MVLIYHRDIMIFMVPHLLWKLYFIFTLSIPQYTICTIPCIPKSQLLVYGYTQPNTNYRHIPYTACFGLGCIGLSHIRLGIFSIPVFFFFFYTDPHIAVMQANAKHGG